MKFLSVLAWVFCCLFLKIAQAKADPSPLKVTYWTVPTRINYDINVDPESHYLQPTSLYSRVTADLDVNWPQARVVFSGDSEVLEVPLRNGNLRRAVTISTAHGYVAGTTVPGPMSMEHSILLVESPLRIRAPGRVRLDRFLEAALAGRLIECTIAEFWLEIYAPGSQNNPIRIVDLPMYQWVSRRADPAQLGQTTQCSYAPIASPR